MYFLTSLFAQFLPVISVLSRKSPFPLASYFVHPRFISLQGGRWTIIEDPQDRISICLPMFSPCHLFSEVITLPSGSYFFSPSISHSARWTVNFIGRNPPKIEHLLISSCDICSLEVMTVSFASLFLSAISRALYRVAVECYRGIPPKLGFRIVFCLLKF